MTVIPRTSFLTSRVLWLIVALLLTACGTETGDVVIPEPTPEPDYELQGRIIGDESATLVIKDYSDFRCPHCKEAAEKLTPEIIKTYVDTGKARLEFVPVVLISEESFLAGQAALCAEEQNHFWAYHDKLFEKQGQTVFELDNLIGFANDLGMEEQPFRDCILSGKYISQLEQNNADFQRDGATGTPTFVIGSEVVGGAVPFSEMQAIIDRQLAP